MVPAFRVRFHLLNEALTNLPPMLYLDARVSQATLKRFVLLDLLNFPAFHLLYLFTLHYVLVTITLVYVFGVFLPDYVWLLLLAESLQLGEVEYIIDSVFLQGLFLFDAKAIKGPLIYLFYLIIFCYYLLRLNCAHTTGCTGQLF